MHTPARVPVAREVREGYLAVGLPTPAPAAFTATISHIRDGDTVELGVRVDLPQRGLLGRTGAPESPETGTG